MSTALLIALPFVVLSAALACIAIADRAGGPAVARAQRPRKRRPF